MSSNLKLFSINTLNSRSPSISPAQSPENIPKPSKQKSIPKHPHYKSQSQLHLLVPEYTQSLKNPETLSTPNKTLRHKTQTSCLNLPKPIKKPQIPKTKSKLSRISKNPEDSSPKSKFNKKFDSLNTALGIIQIHEESKNKEINEKIQNLNKNIKNEASFEMRLNGLEDNLLDKKNRKTGYKIIGHRPKLNKTVKETKDLKSLNSGIIKFSGSYRPDSDRKKTQFSRESSKFSQNEKNKAKSLKKKPDKNGILSANSNFNNKLSRNYSVYSEKRVKFSEDTKFNNETFEDVKTFANEINGDYKENFSITSSPCNTEPDEWINIFSFYTAGQNSDFVEEFKEKMQKSNEKLKKIIENPEKSNINISYEGKSSCNSEDTLTQDRTKSFDINIGQSLKSGESLQFLLHSTQHAYSKPSLISNFTNFTKSLKNSASNCSSEVSSNNRNSHKHQYKE